MIDQPTTENIDGSQIAIIGMAGRFPGAQSTDAFWNNLINGVESVTFFTDKQLQASGVNSETLQNPNYVKARAVLEDVALFDAAFFGFSPREAGCMDPQHRLFLECVWEAIENAGYDTETYEGAIGVFAGASRSTYLINNLYANPEAMALAGTLQTSISNSEDALTTRIAYKLNLKGPSYTIQTFCSTSLVCVHVACQSLLNFECDMAVAGGVSINVPQNTGYWYEEGNIVSPDGHCRPFDANAKGTVFGNGLGAVVLKRIEDALADGDHIDAMIIGSATNNDGSLKVSYTAPSVTGQAEVISEALANADVDPETITYVETHGTGTALGDPTEMTALTRAFGPGTGKQGFCAIGSAKANIGHLDRASGVAGLIKAILALKHRTIPPTVNYKAPNPEIEFKNSPFYVNAMLSEWKSNGAPRRAGVSSFGVGGTNAHLILQEATVTGPSSASRSRQLLILSAKTGSALETVTRNIVTWFKQHPELKLPDAAYTLQIGRKAFNHRRMIVCRDAGDAVSALEAKEPKRMLTVYQERRNPPVVFMFPGQGAQYVDMGLELYKTESLFQEQIDRCSEILRRHLSLDLRDILYPNMEKAESSEHKLKQTLIAQSALFTIEYALARLWMTWGVKPEALVGHSIGEYVAACLAGVFSLEKALSLVAARGRLMQSLAGGSMLVVPLPEQQVHPFLGKDLSLAAVNAPALCVVSGEKEAVANLEQKLSQNGVTCRHLHTSHAFHSKMMDPIIEEFTARVKQADPQPPQIPFLSNVTGTWITPDEAMSPAYWAGHLRNTVRFSDCIQTLLSKPERILLEAGPGRTLGTLARQHIKNSKAQIPLASIRHPKEKKSDIAFILETLGKLWLAGIEVDWLGFYKDERRHRIALPTYPFERRRYWVEPIKQQHNVSAFLPRPAHEYIDDPVRPEAQSNDLSNENTEVTGDYLTPADLGLQSDYAAPRNAIEKELVEIWQKLLDIRKIGICDNYFDLGGNSLLAVRMFADIEKRFQKKIPMATLINAPTVEQLACLIADKDWTEEWSSLVTFQKNGSKPPFFCIHAAGGNILIYRDLAQHLGPDQPFYALQSQGLDGKQPVHTRIEDMASHYIKEIQTVQPEGPYMLGGYCLGGTIAYEMAQQLYARGQKVSLLALLETYNWSNLPDKSLIEKAYHSMQRAVFHWRNIRIAKSKWTFLQEKIKMAKSRRKVVFGMIASKIAFNHKQNGNYNRLLYRLWKTSDLAAADYTAKTYPGQITLFRPIQQYARYDGANAAWDDLAAGGVETVVLPVYPAGMILEPFVVDLAENLENCIKKANKTA